MAIVDQLQPDFSQNFSCSFEIFYFKLHIDCFVAGVKVCSVGIKRLCYTACVFT